MSFETLTEHEWDEVDRVWDMLDGGDVGPARSSIDGLLRKRPGHPDLRIVDAAVAIEEGEPGRALESLSGAEQSADPALFFHLRALAHFERVELERAREDAERALAVQPDLAETHALLGRVFEMLGDEDGSAEHFAEATLLDSEGFPPALDVGEEEFDKLVELSLQDLPEPVLKELEELPVLIEPLPDPALLKGDGHTLPPDILGMFVGRHLLERRHDDLPSAPGAIYLFRNNLLRACRDRDELTREVRITVQHEVGHLLGLDEDDLERWGLA